MNPLPAYPPELDPDSKDAGVSAALTAQGKRIFPLYENAMTDNCLCKPA